MKRDLGLSVTREQLELLLSTLPLTFELSAIGVLGALTCLDFKALRAAHPLELFFGRPSFDARSLLLRRAHAGSTVHEGPRIVAQVRGSHGRPEHEEVDRSEGESAEDRADP